MKSTIFPYSGALLLSMFLSVAAVAQDHDWDVSFDEVDRVQMVARNVLEQIDFSPMTDSRMVAFYDSSGDALKARYSVQAYAKRLSNVRGTLGLVQQRKFAGFARGFNKLPNIIDGEYLIIAFRTQFQGRNENFTEQVTLERDRSGGTSWRFVEYYAAPLLQK